MKALLTKAKLPIMLVLMIMIVLVDFKLMLLSIFFDFVIAAILVAVYIAIDEDPQ